MNKVDQRIKSIMSKVDHAFLKAKMESILDSQILPNELVQSWSHASPSPATPSEHRTQYRVSLSNCKAILLHKENHMSRHGYNTSDDWVIIINGSEINTSFLCPQSEDKLMDILEECECVAHSHIAEINNKISEFIASRKLVDDKYRKNKIQSQRELLKDL